MSNPHTKTSFPLSSFEKGASTCLSVELEDDLHNQLLALAMINEATLDEVIVTILSEQLPD